jgi:hypothetical protein
MIGTQFPTKIYHIGEADPEKLALCKARAIKRARYCDPKTLGDVGEIAIRQTVILSRSLGATGFTRIPQRSRRGRIPLPNSSCLADLLIHYRTSRRREVPLLLQVKNERKEYYITEGQTIPTLIRTALESDTQPVLICSYMAERTKDYLRRIGIAHYATGRQFLPTAWKRTIKGEHLIPADLLKDYFQFINPERPFRPERTIDRRSIADAEAMGRTDWIDLANDRWNRMKRARILPTIADLLEAREMSELNELLGA